MQIGRLAKDGGVTVQAIRFYERLKLMPQPRRKESGYRVYSDEDVKRLRFIRQAKTLGFTLEEIRDILQMRGRGECPCGEVVSIAERHLRDVETQIRHLSRFRTELRRAVSTWKRLGEPKVSGDAICALIERTMRTLSTGVNKR